MTPAETTDAVTRLRGQCVAWARSYGATDPEDVAHAAIEVLLRRADDVDHERAAAFLRTAVLHKAREASRRREVPMADVPDVAGEETPEDTLVSAQLSERVRRALDEVADSKRRILAACALDERQVLDVARDEGLPESTVRLRRDAGKDDLRARLDRQRETERRKTGGSTSWAFLPLLDVRAWRRTMTLLGTTAAVVVAGGASPHIPAMGPTPDEPVRRVAEVAPVLLPVNDAMGERGQDAQPVSNPYTLPRRRHDVHAAMLAARMRQPK